MPAAGPLIEVVVIWGEDPTTADVLDVKYLPADQHLTRLTSAWNGYDGLTLLIRPTTCEQPIAGCRALDWKAYRSPAASLALYLIVLVMLGSRDPRSKVIGLDPILLRELYVPPPMCIEPPAWMEGSRPPRSLDGKDDDIDFIEQEIRSARVLPLYDEWRVRGELSSAAVRRFVSAHASGAVWCYQQALARRPSLRGRVSLRIVINPRGKIESAAIVASELHDASLERCITELAGRGYFLAPDDGREVKVTYSLELTHARTGPPPWSRTK
jgi:hypothetical protein